MASLKGFTGNSTPEELKSLCELLKTEKKKALHCPGILMEIKRLKVISVKESIRVR
jgi:hypothetical protein